MKLIFLTITDNRVCYRTHSILNSVYKIDAQNAQNNRDNNNNCSRMHKDVVFVVKIPQRFGRIDKGTQERRQIGSFLGREVPV